MSVIAIVGILTAGSSNAARQAPGGTITLRAGVLEISSTAITASGAPSLSSDQGLVRAPRFAVALDSSGRATEATATGGVKFNLRVAGSRYSAVDGTCSQIIVLPGVKQAVLQGNLKVALSGPGLTPVYLNGSSARVFTNAAGKPSVIRVQDAQGSIPSQ